MGEEAQLGRERVDVNIDAAGRRGARARRGAARGRAPLVACRRCSIRRPTTTTARRAAAAPAVAADFP